MSKELYQNNFIVEIPTVVIKHRNYDNIGSVTVTDMVYTNNFNSPNELSFTVHASGTDSHIWDKINDYNIVFLPEYGEYFDMQVEKTEEQEVIKKVTCRSLCESELSQINLYDIEINTDADIAREDYNPDFPTIFYRESDKSSSLLHRILDKAPHYSIGHVDDSLKNLNAWYEFSLSNTTIYDALMGEISEMYKCLFTFDAATRTVNAYDLCNVCRTDGCGYRGEFTDTCPKCGGTHFAGAYGKDTAIFISRDNLARSATIKSNKDSLKNCFHVEGGDDIITDAVANLNPTGTNYIYYFSPEVKKEMPDDLVLQIEEYNRNYNYSYNDKPFPMPDLTDYNAIIANINQTFSKKDDSGKDVLKFHPIETTKENGQQCVKGYKNAMKYLYEATDLAYFLQSSMFPTTVTENETLEDTLGRLTAENLGSISVSNVETAMLVSVDRAVENYCRVYVNTALYKISTQNTSITEEDGQKTWHGTIKLTEIANKEHYGQTTLTLTINSNLEDFLRQKLEKELAKADKYAKSITDMKLAEDKFVQQLKSYNIDYLASIKESFQSCLEIIENLRTEKGEDVFSQELYDKFYSPYFCRIEHIDAEIAVKARLLETVKTISDYLKSLKETERTDLDFKAFLGEKLWNAFCSYRREDSYQNSNYISSNLSDSEIIEKAEELLDAAKEELFKAGNMQFEVNADINNLLALPEFHDFSKDFRVGNWIHLMVDETVYHLRLLSYQITFDDLVSISVEFSTLTKTAQGISDFNSVIQTTSSLSSSYSSFKQQMKHTISASGKVNDLLQNGVDTSKTRIYNDAITPEIVFDGSGILCRAYDDIENTYDCRQIKLNRNALFLTQDNWNTLQSAIGKYYYADPGTGKIITGYGVIADTLVGRVTLGETLRIYNKNNSLRLDEDGLIIKNGANVIFKSSSGATVFSDERLENSSKPLDEFDAVFLDLNPCAFKFNNDTSDRFHFGFGAGQIRDAFLSHGFTTQDFGGFVQMEDQPGNEDYCGCEDPMGLIYTEFTSWNTHMIQKLYQENEDLKQQIADLTQQNEDLTQQSEDLTQQITDFTQQITDLKQQIADLEEAILPLITTEEE